VSDINIPQGSGKEGVNRRRAQDRQEARELLERKIASGEVVVREATPEEREAWAALKRSRRRSRRKSAIADTRLPPAA
jgi:hypothetical protein